MFKITTTLATAKISDNPTIVVPPEDLEPVVDRLADENKVILGGVFYKYARLKPDLKESQLIMEGGVLHDSYINGVWQNPYEVKQSFVLTPINDFYRGQEVAIQLPSDLWFSNMNDSIQGIEIDFGNGEGFKPIALDSVVRVAFPHTGRYEWTTKLTLANELVLYSPTSINVTADLDSDSGCDNGRRELGFTGIRPYQGKINKAFIQIRYGYGNENCEMRKPLIVAEGYDPGLEKKKDGLGTNRLSDFESDFIWNAGDELEPTLLHYDIVYVNWLNATDDMHRNAYLLEDIIKWVNAQKALSGSTEPNIVIGQSMGGVIARYALRDMENRGENHDTWLYISHDAPHQGANIPQGIIKLAEDVGFNIPSAYFSLASMQTERNDVKKMLQAPATKQLVKEISGSSNLFQEWQTELKNMGYPQQTRNIAISNGSGCGQKQDITFKEQIVDGYIPLKNKVQIFGTGLGKIKYGGINIEAYASPDVGQTSRGFYIRIYNRVKILGMTSTNVIYKNNVNITSYKTPLDTYAGGVYEFDLKMDGVDYKPFNFVPITSAFDVGKGNVVLTEVDYLKSYSPSDNPPTAKQIPFDNFIAPRTGTSVRNIRHISFDSQIGDWLAKEIKQETPAGDCSFICATDEQAITGNALICQTEFYQTSLNADSYQWQVIQGNDLVTLQVINNKKVALTRKNKSGPIVLQLRVSANGCGEVTFTKEIWVGTPDLAIKCDDNSNCSDVICTNLYDNTNNRISVKIKGENSAFPVDEWQWEVMPGTTGFYLDWNNAPTQSSATIGATTFGIKDFRVRARNQCGWSPWMRISMVAEFCGGIGLRFNVYPNPTTDMLYIENEEADNVPFSGTLYDMKGSIRVRIPSSQSERVEISVRELERGMYILNIVKGTEEENHNIIVK